MITLALDPRAVGLVEDGGDLVVFHMTEGALWRSFRWNSQDFRALRCYQRFPVGDEVEEAAQPCQSAVPCSDGCLSLLLCVLQEGQHLGFCQVGQSKLRQVCFRAATNRRNSRQLSRYDKTV